MSEKQKVNIIWFRRDLRLSDNAALYHALKSDLPVVPLFIFDKNILDQLDDEADRRVEFIHVALHEMQDKLMKSTSSLEVYHGFPLEVFRFLLNKYDVNKVFTNHDYEPYAIKRDAEIMQLLKKAGVHFLSYKDHVIFEKDEVLKDDKKPYTVFSPYGRKWKSCLNEFYTKSYPSEAYFCNLYKQGPIEIPSLESIGFKKADFPYPSRQLREDLIKKYTETRNFPGAAEGTSRLGVHLRFGTTSIRELVRAALVLNDTYLNELVWREFYQMILWHFPQVGEGKAFKLEYEKIPWRNNEEEFKKWCEGATGYPLVDAGMRELNATGFMHNRVRMVTASFLTKHLLIDWRWGESYFAQKLLDYEFASNNGGWQWAAGSGCDAAPYFRIFNPTIQLKKFDKGLEYVKKWVPEFQEFNYPTPIVDHEFARKRALEVYGKALRQ